MTTYDAISVATITHAVDINICITIDKQYLGRHALVVQGKGAILLRTPQQGFAGDLRDKHKIQHKTTTDVVQLRFIPQRRSH